MAADYSICHGTAGWGVWHSPDAGKSWIRHRAPFPLNSRIQALVAHPKEAHTVLAGGDTGLFVSHNGGARWERISANGANGSVPTIWSLASTRLIPIFFLPARVRLRSIAHGMGDCSGRNWLWTSPGSAPLAHPS